MVEVVEQEADEDGVVFDGEREGSLVGFPEAGGADGAEEARFGGEEAGVDAMGCWAAGYGEV